MTLKKSEHSFDTAPPPPRLLRRLALGVGQGAQGFAKGEWGGMGAGVTVRFEGDGEDEEGELGGEGEGLCGGKGEVFRDVADVLLSR